MERNRENTNLPAQGGVFAHSFSPDAETRGGGLFAFVLMAFTFVFIILMFFIALIGGGVSLLLGRPRKINFDYSLGGRNGAFGGDAAAHARDDDVIDVTATDITGKTIEGK